MIYTDAPVTSPIGTGRLSRQDTRAMAAEYKEKEKWEFIGKKLKIYLISPQIVCVPRP